jgi:hypothetical protein
VIKDLLAYFSMDFEWVGTIKKPPVGGFSVSEN